MRGKRLHFVGNLLARTPPIGGFPGAVVRFPSKSFSEEFEAGTRLHFTIILICFILCQLVAMQIWSLNYKGSNNWRFMEIQLGSAGKNHPLQGVTTQAFQRLLDWIHLTSRRTHRSLVVVISNRTPLLFAWILTWKKGRQHFCCQSGRRYCLWSLSPSNWTKKAVPFPSHLGCWKKRLKLAGGSGNSNMLHFPPMNWGSDPNLTVAYIFQVCWFNHQL